MQTHAQAVVIVGGVVVCSVLYHLAKFGWTIEILGQQYAAHLQPRPLFDADGRRLNG